MEAYNVGVFAVGQNSYLLLNDVEVLSCVCVCVCVGHACVCVGYVHVSMCV